MSTTTQILFNSPALHSLKRDQLIKLCKIHNIKASGKNTELVDKLKNHAQTLPRDAPLSFATRSENAADYLVDEGDETMNDATERLQSQLANVRWGFQPPRPSEQWDVVMDNIEEVDEKSLQGTLNSLKSLQTPASQDGGSGEFGTKMLKSPSVTSSLKSLASSFVMQRGNDSKATSSTSFPSSLAETSTPYSSLPDTSAPPQTDHFANHIIPGNPYSLTAEPLPLPGHSLRPGVPAPSNARLSFGLDTPSTPIRDQPTTTIRLISSPVLSNDSYGRTPQLQPFKTSFDLDFGSPQPSGGFHGVSLWPPTEGQQQKKLYPPLPLEDLVPMSSDVLGTSSSATFASKDTNLDVSLPSSLAPPKSAAPSLLSPAKSTTTTQLAATDPFLFGSPLPQHNVSNSQFKSAAANVLEEMNNRLKQEGVDGVGMDLITKLQPGAHAAGVNVPGPCKEKEIPKTNVIKEKFDKLHEEEFSKMEGIDSLMKRRGLLATKDGAAGRLVVKRDSSVGGAAGHGVGRDRFGRRVGGEGGRLSSARIVSESRQRRRSRVIPGAFGEDDEDEAGGEGDMKPGESAKAEIKNEDDVNKVEENDHKAGTEEEERKGKEREVIKRKIEMNKARKSSVAGAKGRVSVGRGGVVVKPQPASQPKTSRFGFLSSAKSLVAKVWGGGKTTPAATAKTNGIPKSTTTKGLKTAPVPGPASAPKKGPTRPSTATNPPVGRVPSLRGEKDKASTVSSTSTSSSSRPPLPSFVPPASTSTKTTNVKPNQASSVGGTGGSDKSGAGVSSLGTRSSLTTTARSSSSGTVGSMGSKKALAGSGSRPLIATSATPSGSSSFSRLSSSKTSSRLLAPTASSLAKTNANRPPASGSKSSLKNVAEGSGIHVQKSQSTEGETLGMITNSPRIPGEPWSPRPGRIFSKPLTMPSGIPTAVNKRSTTTTTENGTLEKDDTVTAGAAAIKQRSLNGRKPRISRSKVIARLASQRAASASRLAPPSSTPGAKAGRTRSSLGVKAQRSSYSGKSITAKGVEDNVMMSAKKRVRQSEYARRKSRPVSIGLGNGADAMEVDAE